MGVEKSVGSPYCIKDYTAVDPEYGTLSDLRTLVERAHALNMGVILDWVPNHTSWDHAWIREHKDWYTQDEEGNIVAPNEAWTDVADLNFDSAEMQRAMIDAMKYWIYEANIDGFRCDAADKVPASFWREAIGELKHMQQTRTVLMLAEGTSLENLKAGFDMDYAWDYLARIKEVYSGKGAVSSLFVSHQTEYRTVPAGKRKLRFITNHDEAAENSPFFLYGGERGAVSAFVLTTCIGGNPLIYSTQEVGYEGKVSFFQPTAVDWGQKSYLADEYRKIIEVCSEYPAFAQGDIQYFSHTQVAAFYKLYERQEAFVLVNTANSRTQVSIDKNMRTEAWTEVFTQKSEQLDDVIFMEPYEYRIWVRR